MKHLSLILALAFLTSAMGKAQQTRRIAVYSFDDIAPSRGEQVGQKLSDRLLSKLANSGVYQMIDRQFLERVMSEQQMAPGRFDASTAVKVGRLANVAAIVDGTITTFTINQRSSEDSLGYYGTVTVAATARLISTETGAILRAPAASNAAKSMIQLKPPPPPICRRTSKGIVCTPVPTPSVETKTLEQLLDEAIEACARSLASDLAAASSAVPSSSLTSANGSTPRTCNTAVVIGVSEGLTYINKGLSSGLKVGQVLQVYRSSMVPGLADLDTGQPLTRKTQICTLTLSDVEDGNASGKCAGALPSSRDTADIGPSAPEAVSSVYGAGGTCAPTPALDAAGRGPGGSFVVGNGVSAPVIISKPEPEYTQEARAARIRGIVYLFVVIDSGGNTRQICVARGLGFGLDQNAIDAVKQWKFRPGLKDGKPVPVYANVEVHFTPL
jgi:TonB family protein